MAQTYPPVNMGGTTDGLLVLSNGRFFRGKLRGAPVEATGEVIFNTSMTGYQEILTDPSYTGQIVTMTYPQIGNYGVNLDDMESKTTHASALIVRELSHISSNWRSTQTLDEWLIEHRIPVLEGVDTRSLVKAIRSSGECSGLLVPSDSRHTLDELREEALDLPSMVGQNLARKVSTRNTSSEEVLEMNPEGVFLSNGPGDPAVVNEAIEAVQNLLGKLPIFGICLGHQILALALGCQTYKLVCGHHGGNHPVMDFASNKIEITSHNHGFSVEEKSLPKNVRITHRNLNDQTVEGIESLTHQAYSVQYHPEAAPGPRDASYLFGRFLEMLKG
jgi:carbamoyl-phosphate synthase small subunit